VPADVSSFANASGGDIIYGVREQSGISVDICGLQMDDGELSKSCDIELKHLHHTRAETGSGKICSISQKEELCSGCDTTTDLCERFVRQRD
jgi:predicted HTH transcriptional regulator